MPIRSNHNFTLDFETRSIEGPLIIGAGLAGLSAALAASSRQVVVVSPTPLGKGCASAWAQGGMAAALQQGDSPETHARDSLAAGAGLVEALPITLLTQGAKQAVETLSDLGVGFDRAASGAFCQSLEAAHSHPRIARVKGDQAGFAIMQAMIGAVRQDPNISLFEGCRLKGFLQDANGRIAGALLLHNHKWVRFLARSVILASGGIGGLYAKTTAPLDIAGEGLGLAALAGASIMDAEFVQFHPTAMDFGHGLSPSTDPLPLATEALRGEGAKLVDRHGLGFMETYDPRAELAPRDSLSRAIYRQQALGLGAFLDASRAVGAEFPDRFPHVFASCMARGLDPRIDPIPITPAAHYHMGGIKTDIDGRTNLAGLYAVGECAATGVHGANRLASNSLLEAAVFGKRVGAAAGEEAKDGIKPISPNQLSLLGPYCDLPPQPLSLLRQAMSKHAGVIRNAVGLKALLAEIDRFRDQYGEGAQLTAASLIARSAYERQESRGAHFREDFPKTAPEAIHSLLTHEARFSDKTASVVEENVLSVS